MVTLWRNLSSAPADRYWTVLASYFRRSSQTDISANGSILESSAGTVKELADKRVADEVAIRDQHHRCYCDNYQREVDNRVYRQMAGNSLAEEDERQVHEVHPVGGI